MFWSVLAHHQEVADPELLDWLKHRIDTVLGLDPGVIVVAIGCLVVSIPIAILSIYAIQQRRQTDR